MPKLELVILAAGALGLASFGTLVKNVHDTHHTISFTWSWLWLNFLGQALTFIYGIANAAYGIYTINIIVMIGLSYVMYIKYIDPEELGGHQTKGSGSGSASGSKGSMSGSASGFAKGSFSSAGSMASGTMASGTMASGTMASGTMASGTMASGTMASGTMASGMASSSGFDYSAMEDRTF